MISLMIPVARYFEFMNEFPSKNYDFTNEFSCWVF